MLTTALTPADRALCSLLAMEEGGVVTLQTSGGPGPLPQLLAEQLVKAGPGGRFVLTAAGREKAIAARTKARGGSIGAQPLQAVR